MAQDRHAESGFDFRRVQHGQSLYIQCFTRNRGLRRKIQSHLLVVCIFRLYSSCVLVNASSQFHAIDRLSLLLVPGIEDFGASTSCSKLNARFNTRNLLKNKVRDDLLRIGMRKADSIFEGCSMDSSHLLLVVCIFRLYSSCVLVNASQFHAIDRLS